MNWTFIFEIALGLVIGGFINTVVYGFIKGIYRGIKESIHESDNIKHIRKNEKIIGFIDRSNEEIKG